MKMHINIASTVIDDIDQHTTPVAAYLEQSIRSPVVANNRLNIFDKVAERMTSNPSSNEQVRSNVGSTSRKHRQLLSQDIVQILKDRY